MSTTELFLLAMIAVLALPWLVWRLAGTDAWAPLVVIQIVGGILLGPGILGSLWPDAWQTVFTPPVLGALNGIAWWSVMLFVCLAGLELDVASLWTHRYETAVTGGLALGTPLIFGSIVAAFLFYWQPQWRGAASTDWQAILGIGMACAVTALPILILFLERLHIFDTALGQRVIRYASLDDIAIWGVLALILLDLARIERQACFLVGFAAAAMVIRRVMPRLIATDRWPAALIWLAITAFAADWSGLHFMVGAFLSGAVMERQWFDRRQLDGFREILLLAFMPVFFLSTGLRTQWGLSEWQPLVAAALLLVASVGGKLIGTRLAGRLLGWAKGEAEVIGWLLQTKALIMIIFVNVLLDKHMISPAIFASLLLMAVFSTALTVPVVTPRLANIAGRRAA